MLDADGMVGDDMRKHRVPTLCNGHGNLKVLCNGRDDSDSDGGLHQLWPAHSLPVRAGRLGTGNLSKFILPVVVVLRTCSASSTPVVNEQGGQWLIAYCHWVR